MKNKKPKFKIGQKVNYLPTLTGLDKKTKLEIQFKTFKQTDSLYEALGVSFEPTWFYGFKNSNLLASESDLKLL